MFLCLSVSIVLCSVFVSIGFVVPFLMDSSIFCMCLSFQILDHFYKTFFFSIIMVIDVCVLSWMMLVIVTIVFALFTLFSFDECIEIPKTPEKKFSINILHSYSSNVMCGFRHKLCKCTTSS